MKPTATSKEMKAGGPRSAWARFWFQPTDPTVLGFMRIITGLLVIYVHLAYCFDLQNFFGAHAYWPIEKANEGRHNFPWHIPPFSFAPGTSWDVEDLQPNIRIPDALHRRTAIVQFLRGLPDSQQERRNAFTYLTHDLPKEPGNIAKEQQEAQEGTDFLRALAISLPDNRETWRDELLKILFPTAPEPTALERANDRIKLKPPAFIQNLPADDRERVADHLVAMTRILPDDIDGISYVTTWFADMAPDERGRTLNNYIFKLPEDRTKRDNVLDYLSMWSVDENQIYDKGQWVFSIWFHITDPTGLWVAHICILFIFVLFTLGIWSNVTSVLTWLAAASYLHRSQQVLFGMDQMMNILLFYLMIGGCGAALSVDRLIARYKAARAIARAGGRPVPWAEEVLAGPARSWRANFALRLFQIHFCFIYLSAGLAKLKGTTWWEHSAPWMTLVNPEFSPIHLGAYEWALRTIAEIRPLINIVCSVLVFFTFVTEIGFPFLVWTQRLRGYAIILAVLFHTGIATFMGLTLFGLFMMTMLLAYFPAALIRERVTWLPGSGPRLAVRFSSRDESQMRTASMIRALDVARQVEWHDEAAKASPAGPVRLTVEGEQTYSGTLLFPGALRSLVLLRPLAFLRFVPGFTALGRWLFGAGKSKAAPTPKEAATPVKTPSVAVK
jgi:hypothetical protein